MLPNDFATAIARAEQLFDTGDHVAAMDLATRLNRQEPGNLRALQLIGCVLSQARPADAVPILRQVLALKPDMVSSHNHLGIALNHLGDTEGALSCYEKALHFDPGNSAAHFNRALAWLKLGNFHDGWVEYEWRWRMKPPPRRPQIPVPRWDGSPLMGRAVLVHTEQGMGDVFQLIRFLPEIHRRGGRIIFGCQKALWAILRGQVQVDDWFPIDEPGQINFQLYCPLISLPCILGIDSLEAIRRPEPYLKADPARIERWRERLKDLDGLKVGLNWQGSRTFGGDAMRSIPLAEFAPIGDLPGISYISLQMGYGSEQIEPNRDKVPMTVLEGLDKEGAFLDTAAIMANLDLVITSDTAIAHLAGALGVPVWVMLSTSCDWRWMHERPDSPWYPSMRLFRQPSLNDWPGVFQLVRKALLDEIATTNTPRVPGKSMPMVPVSIGELVDKWTILAIKTRRLTDPSKLENVRREADLLQAVLDDQVGSAARLQPSCGELEAVNEKLWEVEDNLRDCERQGDFGERFVSLARSVYHLNDKRAALKRQLNEALGSALIEEKSYAEYARLPPP